MRNFISKMELETKGALELERLLKMAEATGKEVEDHMFTLQQEFNGL